MKRIIALVLVLMLILTGCGGGNDKDGVKEITLALWDEVQAPVIQQNVDKFNAANEGKIKVTISQVPWSDYWSKLDASLTTDQAPDVLWMNVYLKKYVDGDTLLSIDDLVKNESFDLGQYVEGRVDAFKQEGKLYALPKGIDSVYVALNKELFTKYNVELPKEDWTWDDMEKTAEELKTAIAAAGGTEYPIAMELDAQPSYINFLRQNGGYYLSEDNMKTGVGEEKSIAAIQRVVDLMSDGLMAPYKVLSETKGTDLFVSGQAGIVFIGSWKASVLNDSTIGKAGNIELIQMPKMDVNNESVAGGLGYAIAKNTKHPEAAWEFVKFITNEASMTLEAEEGIDFPANKAAQAAYTKGFTNLNAQVIIDAGLTSFPYPANGNFEWTTIVNDAIQLVFSGKADANTALKEAQEKANKTIADAFK